MKRKRSHESGFSYLDVLIAVSILLIGVLALAGAMTASLLRIEESEEELRAKQLAVSSVEAIFSARDISTLTFGSAKNVSSPGEGGGPGIFLDGAQPIRPNAGGDGIIGTADDSGTPLPGYTRTIVITPIDDVDENGDGNPANDNATPISLRRVEVTINYSVAGRQRRVSMATLLGNYRTEV